MQTSRLTAVIILIMAAIYIICRLIGSGRRLTSRAYNRSKDRLIRQQIAKSLEESAPIHLDINDSGEAALGGGVALAAAKTADTVSAQMAFADEPWAITAPGGLAVNIAKDSVRSGMEAADYGSSYDGSCAVFTGTAPFEHTAGNAAALEMGPSALHLAIGSFGASTALNDTLHSKGDVLCVGGDDLISQAVAAVTADAVFVGEQYTEIPDSLDHTKKVNSSLLSMDIMRWLIIAAIIIFAGVGLTGI